MPQVGEPAKSPQIGLLDGILRHRRVAQHPQRRTVGHRLSGLHEPAAGFDVTCLSCQDETIEGVHSRQLLKGQWEIKSVTVILRTRSAPEWVSASIVRGSDSIARKSFER